MSKALGDGVRKGLLARNVAKVAPPPSATAARAREFTAWTPSELREFLDLIADHRFATLFRLYAMTGMPRGEGCGLRWPDVELDVGRLTVPSSVAVLGRSLELGDVKSRRSRRIIDLDAGTSTWNPAPHDNAPSTGSKSPIRTANADHWRLPTRLKARSSVGIAPWLA